MNTWQLLRKIHTTDSTEQHKNAQPNSYNFVLGKWSQQFLQTVFFKEFFKNEIKYPPSFASEVSISHLLFGM